MVRVTDQSIPPALQAIFNALVSPQKAGATGSQKQRTRRKARTPKGRKKVSPQLKQYQRAATALAHRLGYNIETPGYRNFIYAQTQGLILGILDPRYWRQVLQSPAETIRSEPTSAEDFTPKPYAYRDPLNRPTTPTYPNGYITSGPAGYRGETTANLFRDIFWSWRRITYWPDQPGASVDVSPLYVRWIVNVGVAASTRGSRPMISLELKAHKSGTGGTAKESTVPPLTKRTSLYWRFKMPPTTAPFFNTYQLRRVARVINGSLKRDGVAPYESITMTAANRPMAGHGYNNNTQVDTTFDADPELYEINPCIGRAAQPIQKKTGGYWGALEYLTGAVTSSYIPEAIVCQGVNHDKALMQNSDGTAWITDSRLRPIVRADLNPYLATWSAGFSPHAGGWTFITQQPIYGPSITYRTRQWLLKWTGDIEILSETLGGEPLPAQYLPRLGPSREGAYVLFQTQDYMHFIFEESAAYSAPARDASGNIITFTRGSICANGTHAFGWGAVAGGSSRVWACPYPKNMSSIGPAIPLTAAGAGVSSFTPVDGGVWGYFPGLGQGKITTSGEFIATPPPPFVGGFGRFALCSGI